MYPSEWTLFFNHIVMVESMNKNVFDVLHYYVMVSIQLSVALSNKQE